MFPLVMVVCSVCVHCPRFTGSVPDTPEPVYLMCFQEVMESLATTCKCHGVSGSCTITTCFKSLPDMRSVGLILQKKYSLAVQVVGKKQISKQLTSKHLTTKQTANQQSTSQQSANQEVSYQQETSSERNNEETTREQTRNKHIVYKQQETNKQPKHKRKTSKQSMPKQETSKQRLLALSSVETLVKKSELVYLTISPDYCLPDELLGSVGTRHRYVTSLVRH